MNVCAGILYFLDIRDVLFLTNFVVNMQSRLDSFSYLFIEIRDYYYLTNM